MEPKSVDSSSVLEDESMSPSEMEESGTDT